MNYNNFTKSASRLALIIGSLALSSSASFAAINFISNGSFENGTAFFPDGAKTGASTIPSWTVTTSAPQQGNSIIDYNSVYYGETFPTDTVSHNIGSPDFALNHALYFVDDASIDTMTQFISGLTPGATYRAGFDIYVTSSGLNNVASNGLDHDASLQLFVGGSSSQIFTATGLPATTWQNHEITFTANNAGTASYSLNFTGGTDPAADFLVDRAYVTATPEPGFYGALAAGFSGLVFAVRRRRKA